MGSGGERRWQRIVLDAEGLSEWGVKQSDGGYLCIPKVKTILLKDMDHFALFLHEVAHAKAGTRDDQTGHDSIWADIYTTLVRCYMQPDCGRLNAISRGRVRFSTIREG